MVQQQAAAPIFDVSLRARKAAVALSVAIATVLTIPIAHAQTLTALHTFNGAPDGREPIAGLTLGAAGNLYGTTYYGGTHDLGLVYRVAHRGSGWVMTPLYSFQGSNDGSQPVGGVSIGPDGNLYGTAVRGGQHGAGTVYKLTPPAAFICRSLQCPWTETPLYQFTGGADGGGPEAAPIFDRAGNMYGTAAGGGTGNSGVVYKLTRSGSGWTESVLYSFAGSPDGNGPVSGVTFDGSGNLYGTTVEGGTAGFGTVYQLTPSGSAWTEKVLYSFQYSNDGAIPYAGVVLDAEGNLYGATFYGGARNGGAIFELMPSNGNWIFSVIYSPELSGLGGAAGTLLRRFDGTLFGTLLTGGDIQSCSGYGCGSVFQLSPSNGGWVYTSLYEFTDGADGGNPEGALILDEAGSLYGTTTGSLGGDGSVFQITP
jgi:uncharacterized repeat protein (TIGR03803 family)